MIPDLPPPSRAKLLLDQLEKLNLDEEPLSKFNPQLTIPDQIALGDAQVRRNLAYAIMVLFMMVNIATLYFLYLLFQTDQSNLAGKLITTNERVVDSDVVITLLGATTVQLGTIMVIMARYLFR